MSGSKIKVLGVDDQKLFLLAIKKFLDNEYDLELVGSGEQALEKIKTYTPDIILLDVTMEGIDGFETCKRILANESTSSCKILMVSGNTDLKFRLTGYESGAIDYVLKPYEEKELRAKVDVIARLVRAERSLKELNVSLEQEVKLRTEQLFKTERMAFLGMHIAEVVHNLKNPLAVISGCADLLDDSYPNDKFILSLKNAMKRMNEMISSILKSNTKKEEKIKTSLQSLLEEEIVFQESNMFLKTKIKIIKDFQNTPTILCNPIHFRQVFGNIITNARDAMMVSLNREKKLTIQTQMALDSKGIVISISDTGTGMEQETLEKIFEPFYTSKPLVETEAGMPTGNGLGLSFCKKMIEAYNGSIQVESLLGQGTTFKIFIPLM